MDKTFTKHSFLNYLILFFLLLIKVNVSGQTLAFPGAEGAGRYTSGGRGTETTPTTVFEVTSLADTNTPGTLRYAVSASTSTYPYRTIVFRVSGTIHLTSRLTIRGNTTIAGQTAPGDGICLADYPVVISGDNVIIRYMRFRMGDRYQNTGKIDGAGSDDALGNLGNNNIIIDHCSISWSTDEALTIYRGDNVTLQWNFITEPLNYSYHFEAGDSDFQHHGYGGIWGARHGSFHHNLIAHCKNRTPRFGGVSTYTNPTQGAEMCDFRNNVLYNWGINNVYGGEGGYYNLVNNYYKWGPSTTSRKYQVVGVDYSDDYPYAKYYLKGNYVDGSAANTNNNWLSVTMKSGNLADTSLSKVSTPFELPEITTQSAADAYASVLANGGASFPKRDTLDARIVNDVKNRTGKIIDVQGGYAAHVTDYEVSKAAWPTLNSVTAPTDTDHDGMPDAWETANALNLNSASDRNVRNAEGYTMLEVYLNSLMTSSTGGETTTGSEASATWPLSSDQSAVVSGNVTATSQTTPLYINNYATFTPSAGVFSGQTFTAQRLKLASDSNWPASQTEDPNQYVNYSISPKPNTKLTVSKVSIDFGPAGSTEAMKANIYYSLDGFQTAGTKLNNAAITLPTFSAANGGDTWLKVEYSGLDINVPAGSTLSLRVYQYWTSSSAASATKYFVEKNVIISGTTTSTLPLDFLSFNAKMNNGLTKQAILDWSTANEVNTKNFEIERSGEGKGFSKIGEVVTRNKKETNNYLFQDNLPLDGTSYYRLKMNDIDGKYTYSSVVSLKNSYEVEPMIYPNPAKEKATVLYKMSKSNGSFSVFSTDGKEVLNARVEKGSSQTVLNVSSLSPGIYSLVFKNKEETWKGKFVKQ